MTDTTTQAKWPTEAEYNTAIEKLSAVYGAAVDEFVELIETVRDDETFHTTDRSTRECVGDCKGCLSERLADAVTRAVIGEVA
jgi:hypothetical protein